MDQNTMKGIVKRALKKLLNDPFEWQVVAGKKSDNPATLKIETEYTAKEVQGITIAYIKLQIKKTLSKLPARYEL